MNMAEAGPAKEGLIEDGRQETQRRDGGYPVEIQGDEGLWLAEQSVCSSQNLLRHAPRGNRPIDKARFLMCLKPSSLLVQY